MKANEYLNLLFNKIDKKTNVTPIGSIQEHLNNDLVWAKVVFSSKNPCCFPETPTVSGQNLIHSTFGIPSSAIQGALLHKLNSKSSQLATEALASSNFRAWPLFPSNTEGDFSFRVSLSHKVTKLKVPELGDFYFNDEYLKEVEWQKVHSNAPLKSSDGVLIKAKSQVQLWKSSNMPRTLATHGVVNGGEKKT
jgi:hypothetical protein